MLADPRRTPQAAVTSPDLRESVAGRDQDRSRELVTGPGWRRALDETLLGEVRRRARGSRSALSPKMRTSEATG